MAETAAEFPAKSKKIVGKLIMVGVWVLIVISLFYLWVVATSLDELRSDPCKVCEEEFGYSCMRLDNPVFSSVNLTLPSELGGWDLCLIALQY